MSKGGREKKTIIGIAKVIQEARSDLHALTGLDISSTVSAEKDNDGWLVTLEVVEKRSIPEGMDILATYETRLDEEGNIQEFRRTKMRKRIDTEEVELR